MDYNTFLMVHEISNMINSGFLWMYKYRILYLEKAGSIIQNAAVLDYLYTVHLDCSPGLGPFLTSWKTWRSAWGSGRWCFCGASAGTSWWTCSVPPGLSLSQTEKQTAPIRPLRPNNSPLITRMFLISQLTSSKW